MDEALRAAGVATTDVAVPRWGAWIEAADAIMDAESGYAHAYLLDRRDELEPRHARDIEKEQHLDPQRAVAGRRTGAAATAEMAALLQRYGLLALPVLAGEPPLLHEKVRLTYLTVPVNLTGLPAICLPVPRRDGRLPASVQLVGAAYTEEALVTIAARVEAAVGQ